MFLFRLCYYRLPTLKDSFALLIQSVNDLIKNLRSCLDRTLSRSNNSRLDLTRHHHTSSSCVPASSLQKTYDALTVTEKNTFDNLKNLADSVQQQLAQSASDLIFSNTVSCQPVAGSLCRLPAGNPF